MPERKRPPHRLCRSGAAALNQPRAASEGEVRPEPFESDHDPVVQAGEEQHVHNRVAVAIEWFWAYLTFRRGTRLITGSNT